MKNKLRKRKTKQKLLLHWAEESEFHVPLRPRHDTRFLSRYTISIHRRQDPGSGPPGSR